jgi:hypothetical protein
MSRKKEKLRREMYKWQPETADKYYVVSFILLFFKKQKMTDMKKRRRRREITEQEK